MADRKKMLDRAKALIARSASDSEEEARTSALLACKLMREQGFEVVDPKEVTGKPKPPVTPPWDTGRSVDPFDGIDFEDLLWNIQNQKRRPPGTPFEENYRKRVEEERARQAADTRRKQAEFMQEQIRREREAEARRRQEERNKKDLEEKRKRKAYANRPCPTNQPTGTMYRKKDIKWKAYPADVSGQCTGCGRPFVEGHPVVWAAGFGVFRSECLDKKKDEFLFVARQPELVDKDTKPTVPKDMEPPPMFCKAHVWTKLYNSKYNGSCRECGNSYYKGDPIRWIRGVGSYHPECWDKVEEFESLEVADVVKAVDAIKKECRNSEWEKLKDTLA